MKILAIDPGVTCGLALGGFTPGSPAVVTSYEAEALLAIRHVEEFLAGAGAGALVVAEAWTPRPGPRTFQPAPLEVIGAVRYLCHRAGASFEPQQAASAKRFSTNAKLQALGWRTPTRGGHADDAVRHLLLAAVRHGAVEVADLLG